MGINGLTKLLGDNAPGSRKESVPAAMFGRKIAIDASMSIYQFLVAVRHGSEQLTNDSGEVTSHLTGIFYRTIKLMESGMKPIYVFDGKPPAFKSEELQKRREKARLAEEALKKATEAGDQDEIEKYSKRTVRATKQHSLEVMRLLRLMGVPVVQATGEAEATCATMARAGLCYATGTEDMDALTFGTPVLVRNLHKSEAQKLPLLEFNLQRALQELELTMDQFIDMCILCGCDYTDHIKGIGPKRALQYIRQYGSIEKMLPHLDKDKYPLPKVFPYEEARRLFKEPDVTSTADVEKELKWSDPDEEGLKKFLCDEKMFAPERIENGLKRIKKCKSKGTQGRLDSFFKVTATTVKRPAAAAGGGKAKKAKKAAKPRDKPKKKPAPAFASGFTSSAASAAACAAEEEEPAAKATASSTDSATPFWAR